MRSKDQIAIITFLEQEKTATPRRLERRLGWTNKHTHAILGRLVRLGIVKNIGKPAHPEYRLVQRWQAKVSSPRAYKSKPAAPSVASVCRQNWQGYHLHKIFGSARA
ncbi:hypothetical protein [Atlantibacter hermannii]|uniref:hypothetical protein n=1 Tax=Atlantibacter hermannii TaxID=565 RepID=UPI00289B272F|nr:hypothetical protein [Atlantibacter hermannii]